MHTEPSIRQALTMMSWVTLTFDNPREIPLYKPLHIRYDPYVHSDQPPR